MGKERKREEEGGRACYLWGKEVVSLGVRDGGSAWQSLRWPGHLPGWFAGIMCGQQKSWEPAGRGGAAGRGRAPGPVQSLLGTGFCSNKGGDSPSTAQIPVSVWKVD